MAVLRGDPAAGAGRAAAARADDGSPAQPAPLPAPALDLRQGAVPAPAVPARGVDGRADPRPAAYERPRQPEWVSGACMLVRRSAFEAIGGFDEGLFLYCEDTDICLRLWEAGRAVRFEPARGRRPRRRRLLGRRARRSAVAGREPRLLRAQAPRPRRRAARAARRGARRGDPRARRRRRPAKRRGHLAGAAGALGRVRLMRVLYSFPDTLGAPGIGTAALIAGLEPRRGAASTCTWPRPRSRSTPACPSR